MRRSVISASGAAVQNVGIYLDDFAGATLRDLDVQATATGTTTTVALFANYQSQMGSGNPQTITVSGSTFHASGGNGIQISGSSNTFHIVRTSAVGSSGTGYGLYEQTSGGNTITVDHSQLSGTTGSVLVSSPFSAGASQLAGTVSTGTATCVASYNGSYTALSATCH